MEKIDQKFLNELASKAKHLPRKRLNHNFHADSSDFIQRMLNTWCVDTYVRPHKHENPDKRESWVILQGKALIIEFNDEGDIAQSAILGQDENLVIEIAPRTWHTVLALEPHTVVYEVKDGPYDPADDKIYAPWAPEEGTSEGDSYRKYLLKELDFFVFRFSSAVPSLSKVGL